VKDIVDLQCDASAAERSSVVIIIALPPTDQSICVSAT
jgi:hypothetical protein